MTLVDSSRKKVNFVKQVIRELKLENTRAVEGRGEELAVSTDHQGRYDVVISRAFSGLDLFVPMALPFLKEGGRIIAMKGRDTDHEAELFQTVSIKMNDGTVIGPEHLDLEIRPYGLPGTDFQRAFMIVRREK
jgi:16S rRNA (guanine527-N7)-methyltransferase